MNRISETKFEIALICTNNEAAAYAYRLGDGKFIVVPVGRSEHQDALSATVTEVDRAMRDWRSKYPNVKLIHQEHAVLRAAGEAYASKWLTLDRCF